MNRNGLRLGLISWTADHEVGSGKPWSLSFKNFRVIIPVTPPKLAAVIVLLLPIFMVCDRLGAEEPAHWKLAPVPPMGWNSYDAFGSSVTETEVLANAGYMKEKLLPHGWNLVVVDYRWSDADAAKHALNGTGGPLAMDGQGRLIPATNRFPSSEGGIGFKALADRIHGIGLRFGIHVMRGIPRQAVVANTPIEGSGFHAADAANTNSPCKWCADMWGVDATKQAGRDYYDSLFRLYASWGVDFVKVDDLSRPYCTAEIEAIRSAIDKSGRPMILSTSPGETPVDQADHIGTHANMWRVSDDFWDAWKYLDHAFDLAAKWRKIGGPGRWPDGDMIPLGHLSIRSVGKTRFTRFTPDEQLTLMSLWSLMPSPLILGMNLPDNDDRTLSLLTNDGVLAVNQDPLGKKGELIAKEGRSEVWMKELFDGSRAVGLFNRGDQPVPVKFSPESAGLPGEWTGRDLWTGKNLVLVGREFSPTVPPHGVVFLRIMPIAPLNAVKQKEIKSPDKYWSTSVPSLQQQNPEDLKPVAK